MVTIFRGISRVSRGKASRYGGIHVSQKAPRGKRVVFRGMRVNARGMGPDFGGMTTPYGGNMKLCGEKGDQIHSSRGIPSILRGISWVSRGKAARIGGIHVSKQASRGKRVVFRGMRVNARGMGPDFGGNTTPYGGIYASRTTHLSEQMVAEFKSIPLSILFVPISPIGNIFRRKLINQVPEMGPVPHSVKAPGD